MNQPLNSESFTIPDQKNYFTAKEIVQQPHTWIKTWEKIQEESAKICSFLKGLQSLSNLNIVLTGAGSSAFIGDTEASMWQKAFTRPAQAIPTTDLVTHFEQCILTTKPLLLISFARSGNSPESTAIIQHANKRCEEVYHLIITCNPDGKLAQMGVRDNSYVFLLPEEAEDQSLAMTNSFTSMTLAATIIPHLISEKKTSQKQIETLSLYGQCMIKEYASKNSEITRLDFNRIVFLGSGPLWGIAKESHLKVQELTNGKIIGKFDSFLGFRHGPKAILNDKTLLIYLVSNNPDVQRYERDLITQIDDHNLGVTTLAISENKLNNINVDYAISMGDGQKLAEELWAIACTLPSQLIGFYKSLAFSYNPDNPSPDGTIARVVEGVKIYDNSSTVSKS